MYYAYGVYGFERISEDSLSTWTAPGRGVIWYVDRQGGVFLSWAKAEQAFEFSSDPQERGYDEEAVMHSATLCLSAKFGAIMTAHCVDKDASFPESLRTALVRP